MRSKYFGVLSLLAAPALSQAVIPVLPTGKSAQGDVAVTIYNEDRALVQDRRDLVLPGGRTRQEFPDVSAQIRPETVTLAGSGISIVEQNFDFDLLSPSALMQKAVGETVTLVRINPATGAETRERARVLAANGGVVVQIGDRIEVLRDDGLPTRVVFDRVPDNLRARPTLSVTLEAAKGGRQPVTLNYLTSGLGWSADYVALFDEANRKMDMQGWITLTNNSGTTFEKARTLLVAGNESGRNSYRRSSTMVRAGTEIAGREQLGGYYLYPLPERTTIANRQTKQVSFLDVHNAAAARGYEYENGWLGSQKEPRSANTVLRFSSSRSAGLGDALPAGTVRVYQRDARGNPQFVGEHEIDHTPMGSDLSLATGEAFDVKVKPTVESREKITIDQWKTTDRFRIFHPEGGVTTGENDSLQTATLYRTRMSYRVTNAGSAPVTVDLTQAGLGRWYADTRIVQESLKSEPVDDDAVRWRVPVPAGGETVVTVTFDTRY